MMVTNEEFERMKEERDELHAFIFDLYENKLEPDKLLCLIERKWREIKLAKGGE